MGAVDVQARDLPGERAAHMHVTTAVVPVVVWKTTWSRKVRTNPTRD